MCGRYAQAKDPATLADEFDAADETAGAWPGPDHNVAPTTTVLGVVDRHPRDERGTPDPERVERTLRPMRWGLVPGWAKDPAVGNRLINARAESLTVKPAFRRAAAGRRCLLPADGWFEWSRDGDTGRKTPYFVTVDPSSPWAGRSLALAGVWETWWPPRDERGDDARDGRESRPLVSGAVVTTAAVGRFAELHHRMPLLVAAEHWADWLDPDRADPTDLLVPPEEVLAALVMRPVSTAVNNVRHHGAELVAEHREQPEQAGQAEQAGQVGLDLDVPAG